MPKLLCTCGYIHNLSPIPDDGYIVIKDQTYESLIEYEINLSQLQSSRKTEYTDQDLLISRINELQERLYKCPDCNEIQWIKKDGTIERYKCI
ncbi:hypothetical protein J41TS4_05430 [Paenibacillus apis]|uniref:Uncharacterized protein n=1 Tax=Paenibacillus apis TaxID=1792174 RepID=A0A919Y1L9_9BACL|nr:hypothetical protein J41TS4_05430 [Paenibacillus apis]